MSSHESDGHCGCTHDQSELGKATVDFDIMTYIGSGLQPVHKGGEWTVAPPVYNMYIDGATWRSGDKRVSGEILSDLQVAAEAAKEGEVPTIISDRGDKHTFDECKNKVDRMGEWKQDLTVESTYEDFLRSKEKSLKAWNDVVTTAFYEIKKKYHLGEDSVIKIAPLDSQDEDSKRLIKLEKGIVSEEMQQDNLKKCLSNVRTPGFWVFAGNKTKCDEAKLALKPKPSKYSNSKGFIGYFSNLDPTFRTVTVPSINREKNISALPYMNALRSSVHEEAGKKFSPANMKDPIHLINVYYPTAVTTKEIYTDTQLKTIDKREKLMVTRMKEVMDSLSHQVDPDLLEVHVLAGRDFPSYKDSINPLQEPHFADWSELRENIESEYDELMGQDKTNEAAKVALSDDFRSAIERWTLQDS